MERATLVSELPALGHGTLLTKWFESSRVIVEFEFEWEFYAQSASKAIFRARTYDCNLFSPVMVIT